MHCRVNVIFMMKFCLNWGGAALLSMLLLCTSCGDADLFDTDKWTNEIEGWEPGVSLKVLQGSFTLWDLINQGDDDGEQKAGHHRGRDGELFQKLAVTDQGVSQENHQRCNSK